MAASVADLDNQFDPRRSGLPAIRSSTSQTTLNEAGIENKLPLLRRINDAFSESKNRESQCKPCALGVSRSPYSFKWICILRLSTDGTRERAMYCR